jgi:hypothetical protein
MHVPTVVLASAGFEHDLEASASAFGMPGIQYVIVPQVFNNITVEEAAAQVEPIVGEVIRLLTAGGSVVESPSTDASAKGRLWTYRTERGTGPFEGFNRDFLSQDWGDGYPLWPPTRARVDALMDSIDGSPDDLVCFLPPGKGKATLEKAAVNAAMAGCEPDDLPVVLASLRAIAKLPPPFNMGALMSTSAHAPLLLINGPIASEIGMNGGRCCLGPGRQNAANIRIGRAVILCLKNLGRWYPGVMDMDTLGSARKFSQCIAENEEESPWEPYHVSRGHDAAESTVTVFFTSGDWDIGFQGHTDPEQLLRTIASSVGGVTSLGYFTSFIGGLTQQVEGRLLLLPPSHAQPLADAGYTKKEAEEFLYHQFQEPISRLIEPIRRVQLDGKVLPQWEWMFELSDEEASARTMHVFERPDQIEIVVVGSFRGKDLMFPTLCLPVTERVTRTAAGQDG